MISISSWTTWALALEASAVESPTIHSNTNVELVVGILLFVLAGFVVGFGGLTVGRIVRPKAPHPEKGAAY